MQLNMLPVSNSATQSAEGINFIKKEEVDDINPLEESAPLNKDSDSDSDERGRSFKKVEQQMPV